MGAGNVKAVFERYANRMPWRPFAALVFMANTSLDSHEWPYYSAGLEHLAAALFKTPEPTPTHLRDVRRLVRDLVSDSVVTKDREASSLRKNPRDRAARYRLNIHEAADLARKQWEADSTGVSDPSTERASRGVKDPSAGPPSTGVPGPSKHGGDSPPEAAQARGSQAPGRSNDLEEEREEYARVAAQRSAASTTQPTSPHPETLDANHSRRPGEPHVPSKPTLDVSTRCARHRDAVDDPPCRACAAARRDAEQAEAHHHAAVAQWEREHYQQWKRWRDGQPRCPEELPGGNAIDPVTGSAKCSTCRRRSQKATQ